jgi:hypothetical protein
MHDQPAAWRRNLRLRIGGWRRNLQKSGSSITSVVLPSAQKIDAVLLLSASSDAPRWGTSVRQPWFGHIGGRQRSGASRRPPTPRSRVWSGAIHLDDGAGGFEAARKTHKDTDNFLSR